MWRHHLHCLDAISTALMDCFDASCGIPYESPAAHAGNVELLVLSKMLKVCRSRLHEHSNIGPSAFPEWMPLRLEETVALSEQVPLIVYLEDTTDGHGYRPIAKFGEDFKTRRPVRLVQCGLCNAGTESCSSAVGACVLHTRCGANADCHARRFACCTSMATTTICCCKINRGTVDARNTDTEGQGRSRHDAFCYICQAP